MTDPMFPQSTVKIAGRPVHPMMVAFPMALLVVTFASDLGFLWTHDAFFIVLSFWSLLFGVLFGFLAGAVGLIDFLNNRAIRNLRSAWIHGIGNIVILGVSLLNLLIRIGDTGPVMPASGIIFSTLVFLAIHLTGWMGWTMVYRHRVGVNAPGRQG